ncbi:hypothetical protein [Chryseobacterium sp. GP-SGM7]|uniref:hypothetical protein n=1 Tax=Chryseobacterium sp. GP-SGM7 TaxID=3411323 RepID=UPI003B94265E
MRTKILLLIMIGLGKIISAQGCIDSNHDVLKNSSQICINPFDMDDYPKGIKFKKGTTLKFVIKNVNPLKVKGSNIVSKVENFQFEVPKLIQDNNITSKEKDSNKDNQKGRNPASTSFVTKDDFIEEYKNFLEIMSVIEKKANFNNLLINLIGDNVFIKNTDVLKNNVEKIYESTYDLDDLISQDMLELQKSYLELKNIYDEINKASSDISISGTISINGSTAKLDNTKLVTNKLMYEEEFNVAKKAVEIINDEKKKNDLIIKAIGGINTYQLIKNNDFTEITNAIQLNDDATIVTPILIGKDDKELVKFNPIKITTYGGIKVNFSSGYMLSFISNDDYHLKYNNEGGAVGVYKNENSILNHALGALAHVFWDEGKTYMFGLSSGISVNTDAKLNFYAGPSFAFLEKNRLIFTGGLSFVNVKRLNRNNLTSNDEFISPNHLDITYSEIYKPAVFFSVTYNLFSKSDEAK